ncbi:hypothetical protein VTN31DRAFT_575 [Thermomyces dupontii]|uniref:uncharacterized protein n=1 Tax=Talaromyces thermophilus TaxID=28565 RepID=UPI00374238FB
MAGSQSKIESKLPETQDLPGFTAPLNAESKGAFPSALDPLDIDNARIGALKTIREMNMIRMMDQIKEKPNWEDKVFDETIRSRWRKEAMESGLDFTEKMLDYMFDELEFRASRLKETGQVTMLDLGVVKSDVAISKDLQERLKKAVRPLEEVPEKDYHPGSDGKVVDLVHPSLYPLVYGRTKILPDQVIGLNDWMSSSRGVVLPVPPESETKIPRSWVRRKPYSQRFQWLPCDVKFTDDGCRITSYINNLHPQRHWDLYQVIEEIIAKAIPLWNETLSEATERRSRIVYDEVMYLPHDPEPKYPSDDSDWEAFEERLSAWEESRQIVQPEPEKTFSPTPISVDLRERFGETSGGKGLQVIVKLANIELTPEKPYYEGGTWHIEGQLNEHICATALYYYSNENITESTLKFRHRVNEFAFEDIVYEQNRHGFVKKVFGLNPRGPLVQYLGKVVTKEGRLLTFPNILQHCVSPFRLADSSKPGHRKILALFLVDPSRRIISTANVPPQQMDWWNARSELIEPTLRSKLPPELQNMVMDDLYMPDMTLEEAKALREELMAERRIKSDEANEAYEEGDFNLCEH